MYRLFILLLPSKHDVSLSVSTTINKTELSLLLQF